MLPAGLVHIGDSRAYLVRGGEMFQITQDHTLVQSLLDDGKITAEEVASHPQRFMLLRALDGGNSEPDLQLREARPGDRYLLCSDGLHQVVVADALARVLLTVGDPDQAAAELIALAIPGGGPDNVSCIVADVVALEEPAQVWAFTGQKNAVTPRPGPCAGAAGPPTCDDDASRAYRQ